MTQFALKLASAATLAIGLLSGTSAFAQSAKVTDATVAFLMPDQSSTRYEEHDSPGFPGGNEEALRRLQGDLPECKR